MRRTLLSLRLCLLLTLMGYWGHSQTLDRKYASTNGTVNAIAQYGDSVYIGGSFTQVGAGAKRMARFSNGSAKPDVNFPELGSGNQVFVSESDGNGGAYLLGNFNNYNGVSITPTYIIHILNGGGLDPVFGSVVTDYYYYYSYQGSLKKIGNVLYFGGYFSTIQGVARPYLAALNATTGALLPWTPAVPDSYITKVEAKDTLVFITGTFSKLGGINQPNGFGVLSANTGKVVNDFPKPNGGVATMKVEGNSLYAAGGFSSWGQSAQGLAKINNATLKSDAEYPQTNGTVEAILPDGSGGYFIGGSFSTVGNQSRQNLAHILSNGSVDPAFNVSVNGLIRCFATDGTNLYFAGSFTQVGTTTRNRGASVLISNGSLTSFNPNLDATVLSIAVNGSIVYMGGDFTTIRGSSRPYAAAINATTNVVTAWNPAPDWFVNKLLLNSNGTSVFLGGAFSTIKTQNYNYLAKVSATTGVPSSWKPQPNSQVMEICLSGSKVYVGGYFSAVNGISKQYFAEIDTTSNNPTLLQADMDNIPDALAVNDNKVYIGGNFSTIQGVTRNYAARIDLATGLVDSWQPSFDYYISAISVDATNTYLGGTFSNLNAYGRTTLAEIDVPTRTLTSFSTPITNGGTIYSIAKSGNIIFLGSNYLFNDGTNNHDYLIGLNSTSGLVSANFRAKHPDGIVNGLIVNNGKLVVSGSFTDVVNSSSISVGKRQNMAAYDLNTLALTAEVYDPNGAVRGMFNDANGKLVVVGDFDLMNYADRNYAASIDMNTGTVTNWNPNLNSVVNAIAVKDATAYIGGHFSQVNTVTRNYLAAVNTTTGAASSWIANANNPVFALAIKDTLLYVGGDFTVIKSVGRSRGAALSIANAAVKGWIPSANGTIRTLLPVDTTVYIGGDFTTVKGTPRNYLALCNTFNGNTLPWTPNPNQPLYSLASTGSTLYVGGTFTSISGQARSHLAAFNLADNTVTNFDAALQYTAYPMNALVPFGKSLYLGSSYYNYIGADTRGNLAGLDTVTKLATAFDPKPNSPVNSLAVGKNKLFAGGSFNQLNNDLSPSYFAVFTLEPQTSASSLNFTNVLTTSVQANWTNGDGEKRMVVVKEGAAPANPADGSVYTANATFGSGSQIGTGGRAVYNGTGSAINVTNLLPNHTYYFAVYEYNGSGSAVDYQQTPVLLGSITTPCPVYTDLITPADTVYVCAGATTVLTAPSGFVTYNWSNGITSVKDTVGAGNYTVTVADSNGCIYTTPAVYVKEYAVVMPVVTASGPLSFCNGDSVTLTVSGGSFTGVLWSTGETTTSITVKTSGNYTVAATEAEHGCTATSAATVVTVNQPSSSEITVSNCNSYFWNDSTYKVSGDYVYHATNAVGCDSTATLHLTILSVTSTFAKTDAGCFGSPTGSLTITPTYGVSPFTYRIGTTGSYVSFNSFTNLKAGNYRVSILDANGCAGISAQVTIAQQPAITGTFTKTDAGCNGSATGSITVTATTGAAPYTYRLGTSGVFVSSNTFSNLRAGTYRVTIADANSCQGTIANIVISEPVAIAASYVKTNVTCYGKATGSITVTPLSGTSPYMYKLGTAGVYGSANMFSNLRAGNYLVFMKDANGCTITSSVNISQPAAALSITATKTDETCPGAKDGSITATGAGGLAPYSYRFGSTGAYGSSNTFNNLKAGNYRVFVSDANGCIGGSVAVSIVQTSPTCSPAITQARNVETAKALTALLQASLYPNPAANVFTLQVNGDSKQPVQVRVTDISGRSVYIVKGQTGQQFKFGNEFATGTYLVEVRQGNEVKTLKAIKVK